MKLGLAPRAADAGLGIGDQVVQVDHAGLDQRQEAQLDSGWIASRIGN